MAEHNRAGMFIQKRVLKKTSKDTKNGIKQFYI